MRIGDLLEWLAAGGFAYGALLLGGRAAAVFTGAACLVYFGQCYGAKPVPRPRLPKRLRRKREPT